MKARRRALSAVMVLALAGALAAPVLVAGAANADNGLALVNPVGVGDYAGTDLTFSGTADASDTSDIVIRNGPNSDDDILCTVPYSANWTCDGGWVPDPGAYTLTAWQDTRQDSQAFTLNVPLPIVDQTDFTIVEGGGFNVSGTTTAPNSSISIALAGGPYMCGPGNYASGAAFWCGLGGWVGTGSFPISITQVVNGVPSAPVTGSLTVLTPGLQVNSPADGGSAVWAADPTFTVSGTTDDLVSKVDVQIDGALPGVCDDITPAGDGSWSCSLAYPRPNEPATHSLTAFQGSNSVTVSFDVTYPAPSWSGGGVFNIEQGDATTTFSGTAGYDDGGPLNESIHVSIVGTGLFCDASLGALSTWSCDIPTSGLSVNGYDVEAYESYGPIAGQVLLGSLTVAAATSGIPTPTIDTPVNSGSYATVTPLISLGGAYDFNALAGGAGGDLYVTVTNSLGVQTNYCGSDHFDYTDPAWTCPNIPLELGTSHLTVQVIETSTSSFTPAATLDVTVGTADAVALNTPAPGSTVATTAAFTGTGPIGGTVEVLAQRIGTAAPAQSFCTATVATDGSWSCNSPASSWGLWDVHAVGTDVLAAVTTTATQQLTISGYPKPVLSWGGDTTGIWTYIESGNGSLSTQLSHVDASNPANYVWDAPVDSCVLTFHTGCTLSPGGTLAPGIWNVYTQDVYLAVTAPGQSVQSSHDDYFYIPTTPTLSRTLNPNRSVTFNVTREAGSTVTVRDIATGNAVCTVSGAGTGGSCTTSPTAGSHQFSAQAVSVGFSAVTGTARVPDNAYDWYSDIASSPVIVVPAAAATPAAPAAPQAPTPTPTPTPPDWSFTVSPSGNLHPGDAVTITGSGVPAGTEISAEFHSKIEKLGETVASDDGTFVYETTIPLSAVLGDHHIVVTATPPGGTAVTHEAAVVLVAADAVPDTGETTSDDPNGGTSSGADGGSGSGETDRSHPAAPSGITGTITTLSTILEDPFVLIASGGFGLALLFLVALPTELLNTTLSRNQSRFGRGFAAIEKTSNRFRDWFIRVTRSRTLAAAIIVLVVSFIFGFVDPNFGFDLTSVRLVLSLAIAFFVLTYGTSWLTGVILKRTDGTSSEISIQPAAIVFAVLGVVVARLLDFTPGFLIGLVIGLELIRATRRASLRGVLIQFGLVLGLALAAWVALSFMESAEGVESFWGALTNDALTAFVAEGLMAILVASFPLRFLEGRELWNHSKWLWFGTFFVIATAFTLLVLPTELNEEGRDYGFWVIVLAAYGLASVIVWAIFAFIDRRGGGSAEKHEERDQVEVL